MPEAMPTEEEWQSWLQHACTKRLRFWATQGREVLKEKWAQGDFSAAFNMEMAVKNAGATGACSVLVDVTELDYNQIVIGAADDNSESLGASPSGPGSAG